MVDPKESFEPARTPYRRKIELDVSGAEQSEPDSMRFCVEAVNGLSVAAQKRVAEWFLAWANDDEKRHPARNVRADR